MAWDRLDQDNLHMEFSAWNVDFSSWSLDFLDSSKLPHAGVKEVYPLKVVILSLLARLTLADRHRLAAYRSNNCRQAFKWFNTDDLERP